MREDYSHLYDKSRNCTFGAQAVRSPLGAFQDGVSESFVMMNIQGCSRGYMWWYPYDENNSRDLYDGTHSYWDDDVADWAADVEDHGAPKYGTLICHRNDYEHPERNLIFPPGESAPADITRIEYDYSLKAPEYPDDTEEDRTAFWATIFEAMFWQKWLSMPFGSLDTLPPRIIFINDLATNDKGTYRFCERMIEISKTLEVPLTVSSWHTCMWSLPCAPYPFPRNEGNIAGYLWPVTSEPWDMTGQLFQSAGIWGRWLDDVRQMTYLKPSSVYRHYYKGLLRSNGFNAHLSPLS